MSQRVPRLDRAVEALLSPRHYEFLLFLQEQTRKSNGLPEAPPKEACRTVLRMITAEKIWDSLGSVEEAGQVIAEALRRLD